MCVCIILSFLFFYSFFSVLFSGMNLKIYVQHSFVRFVKGCRPGYKTAFDIDVADLELLEQSHEVIVASAIFGTAAYKLHLSSRTFFFGFQNAFEQYHCEL